MDFSHLASLKMIPLLRDLDPGDLDQLMETSFVAACNKREAVYPAGEESKQVYFVLSGLIKLVRTTPEGDELILALVRDGELFGEHSLIEDEPLEESAVCAVPSTVLKIPREEILRLMRRHAAFALGITRLSTFRTDRLIDFERRRRSSSIGNIYGS